MTKNTIILVSMVMVSLSASCTKVERMESSEDVPVSYQVIQDIVHSKAGELEYDKDTPFKSSAFYLEDGKFWRTDMDDAVPYIDRATISYAASEDVWRDQSAGYYWPKIGSLTFFSWSPASIPDSKITIDKISGVCLTDWNTYTTENRSVDFMVADVVYDKKSNETAYFYNGVPTLFRHQLAKISFFAYLEKEEAGKWTKIKKVYLTNIYAQADYVDSDWSDWEDVKTEWVIYDNPDGILLTIDSQQLGEDAYMIPQNLSAATGRGAPHLCVIYDNEGGTNITKAFSFTDDVLSYFWAKGTKTRYSISYGTSDQPIDFDADVEDWVGYGNKDVNIGQI